MTTVGPGAGDLSTPSVPLEKDLHAKGATALSDARPAHSVQPAKLPGLAGSKGTTAVPVLPLVALPPSPLAQALRDLHVPDQSPPSPPERSPQPDSYELASTA